MSSATDATMKEVDFYGGAILTLLPKTFLDASTLRDVPDNQEVWVDEESEKSVIFEILEYQSRALDDSDPLHFFFSDLATHHSAEKSEKWSSCRVDEGGAPHLPASCRCFQGSGVQWIAKTNRDAATPVRLDLALVRLPEVESDILMYFNDPGRSGSADDSTAAPGREVISKMLASLRLVDMTLFTPPQ
mmetsp:Transcript_12866/g.30146  ORF Transcript_12866/g.30146 Transcript_12866/m.30146 type:complete len:189 (-) Transcript_12866:187-753(-)